MKKVFLSPSNQTSNRWVVGNTNEKLQAEAFADKLEALLEQQGVTVVRADKVKPFSRINNAKGCDLYVPLHTNAHNGNVRGCRLFVYRKMKDTPAALAAKNDAAMQALRKAVDKINMTPEVKVYYDFASWAELNNATAAGIPAVYSESIFHDNVADCNWYFQNVDRLAAAYAEGICNFLGVTYKVTAQEPQSKPPVEGKIWRVQVGAYSKRANAEAQQAAMKALGYSDAFIAEVDGKLWRVQVGAFTVKANAEKLRDEIIAKGHRAIVTSLSGTPVASGKTVDELAKEVILGKWGTGTERKQRLTAAGYDYAAIQARVNALLKG